MSRKLTEKQSPGRPAGGRAKKSGAKPAKNGGNGRRPRGTGASYVYESLRAKILDLELQPGTFLDETELSRQFGVSRSPVREALIRLSAERLVQNLRNRTSIVAPFDVADLPAYFDAMMLLYRLSARLAAGHPDPARIARLRQIQAEHEVALSQGDMKAMVRCNRAFHIGIAEMTGNSFIVDWMQGLLDQGQRVLRLYAHHLGDKLSGEVLGSHREMLAAIEAGDARRAEEAGRTDAATLIEEFRQTLADLPTAQISLATKGR
jgi:DNA-binding GntR family transcriptional regulator